ncbi:adenylyl-sulfate reductase subunit alpha [Veillonella criceti]|uniref:Fumarate reductase flavoprotein subunit n=1 Tax=Veillonella criceti TaxID=103891 RepID=A0A380NLX3_9FIRM|nr:adenylyl-sulfate reductase subunit alpha [Veillonella criceti]SUP43840.1 Fumarate reductase flavoprotein subunit precursor [Veillonella criceti]
MKFEKRERIDTDVLIIGGGTAGCYAALTLQKETEAKVLIVEKAAIRRSGCLAAGVNALNAYIVKGRKPQDYVDYATKDAAGIVRQDLLLSMSERLNGVTKVLEDLGLVILKDANGDYMARGNRNIKINGENIKPLLADAVLQLSNTTVMEHVIMTDYLVEDGEIKGAVGFSLRNQVAYEIYAPYVICATGGAAGLYRPNNPGFSRHKMWYSPFNTGAGYAMGIQAGAEMTTFEMRFIALRCKDTIAPTGTIAQGVGAKQINADSEVYETKYGLTTSQRVYGTVKETLDGHGPCYLATEGITSEQNMDLLKAYLNMAPGQTLKWLESGKGPQQQNVEIEGTEPYIVGGHTASGYWVDTNRETTIRNLYAAGDVAGGCPQKYVTGALAEGEIAALAIAKRYKEAKGGPISVSPTLKAKAQTYLAAYDTFLTGEAPLYTTEQLEEAMQRTMDSYAGGIGAYYRFNSKQLAKAKARIEELQIMTQSLKAHSLHDLLFIYELKERLVVCLTLIAHLAARKETRWHSFAENLDYPETSEEWLCYVNSVATDKGIEIRQRPLVKEDYYEHQN